MEFSRALTAAEESLEVERRKAAGVSRLQEDIAKEVRRQRSEMDLRIKQLEGELAAARESLRESRMYAATFADSLREASAPVDPSPSSPEVNPVVAGPQSCQTCRCWRPSRGPVGSCLAHPPVASVYPVVNEGWWCGEWRAR